MAISVPSERSCMRRPGRRLFILNCSFSGSCLGNFTQFHACLERRGYLSITDTFLLFLCSVAFPPIALVCQNYQPGPIALLNGLTKMQYIKHYFRSIWASIWIVLKVSCLKINESNGPHRCHDPPLRYRTDMHMRSVGKSDHPSHTRKTARRSAMTRGNIVMFAPKTMQLVGSDVVFAGCTKKVELNDSHTSLFRAVIHLRRHTFMYQPVIPEIHCHYSTH